MDEETFFIIWGLATIITIIFFIFHFNYQTINYYTNICNDIGLGTYIDSEYKIVIEKPDNGSQVECSKGFIINQEICELDKWGNLIIDSCKTNWVINK